MTPMSGAFDWLAVGDVAEERNAHNQLSIGGTAGRLAAHAAFLKASVALVGKVGEDESGAALREQMARLHIGLEWLHVTPQARTTAWFGADGQAQRRVERGADLSLRLDELPSSSVKARLTVVSGYSLSVEPSRSAAMGALAGAAARGGRAALLVDAHLLWSTNARITRRVLEPALAAADSIALTDDDARLLVGTGGRDALRLLSEMGPRIIYLTEADGSVLVRDGARMHGAPAPSSNPSTRDRLAGPAAFWVALANRAPVTRALEQSTRYAAGASGAASRRR